MPVIDPESLERLEAEVEELRAAVHESERVANEMAAAPWPSRRATTVFLVALFAAGAFFVGRAGGAAMARRTPCAALPAVTDATIELKTPTRTIALSTDGQVAISTDKLGYKTVRRRQVSPAAVRSLVDRFATSCFFEMHADYIHSASEPANELTVRAGSRSNTVRHPPRFMNADCATPASLSQLEADAIDLATRD